MFTIVQGNIKMKRRNFFIGINKEKQKRGKIRKKKKGKRKKKEIKIVIEFFFIQVSCSIMRLLYHALMR